MVTQTPHHRDVAHLSQLRSRFFVVVQDAVEEELVLVFGGAVAVALDLHLGADRDVGLLVPELPGLRLRLELREQVHCSPANGTQHHPVEFLSIFNYAKRFDNIIL